MGRVKELDYTFRLIENDYFNYDTIKEQFTFDYLHSTLKNDELKEKYNLTRGEFNTCCDNVLKEYNLSRRPHHLERQGKLKYYYKTKYSVIIQKRIDGVKVYLGSVPSVDIALQIIEMCKNVSWDIDKCKDFCKNWSDYIE